MDQLTFCPFVTHLLSCRFDFFVTLFGFIGAVTPASFSFIVCLRPLRLLRYVLCVKIWIILSCNSRGLIDLVAKYLNHHASPGKKRSALNHLYMLWSIFLKKTVIPVKPFGCKRLWPTHCWALHQSSFLLPTSTMPKFFKTNYNSANLNIKLTLFQSENLIQINELIDMT